MRYIILAIVLLIVLCLQAFFYPIIYNWYIKTFFSDKDHFSGFMMVMVMTFTAFGALLGCVFSFMKGFEKD